MHFCISYMYVYICAFRLIGHEGKLLGLILGMTYIQQRKNQAILKVNNYIEETNKVPITAACMIWSL